MMAAVAFLALALAVSVQSVRLHQALIREQQLRAEAELQRARALAEYRRTRAFVDTMFAGIAEPERRAPAAAPKP
jgi:hypothetical protein